MSQPIRRASTNLTAVAGETLLLPRRILFASCAWFALAGFAAAAQPEILGIAPANGPEGTRVEISGREMADVSAVRFGETSAVFEVVSSSKLIAIVPHRVSTSMVNVISPGGRSNGRFAFVVLNDPRIPDEVSYKGGVCECCTPAGGLWLGAAVGDCDCGYAGAGVRIRSGGSGLDSAVVPSGWERGCP